MPLIVVENVTCAPSQTQITIGSFKHDNLDTLLERMESCSRLHYTI
jgi:hypothetical protein